MDQEIVQHPPWYIEPYEGESISHYFGRFRRNEAISVSSPGSLSKAAGIGPVLARWEKFRFNPFPSPKELEAISKLSGLDATQIAQILPPKDEKIKLEPIRLCAACYAEQPYHGVAVSIHSGVCRRSPWHTSPQAAFTFRVSFLQGAFSYSCFVGPWRMVRIQVIPKSL